jgi:hypothetical protein
MKRALLVVVVLAAGLLTACLPVDPNLPPGTPRGFDACAAPSTSTMKAWQASSPYTSLGVYIGGANRGCAQPNLTKTWVSTVWGQGWKLLPIWVGPQASCTTLSSTTKLSTDGMTAFFQGVNEAQAAADAAGALGIGLFAPIYYDMEGYPRGGTCTASVQSFTDGWVIQLHNRGYLAAMYSSLCSGILDQAASVSIPGRHLLDAIWIAAWNNNPQIFGFTGSCSLDDGLWWDHQRVHQYTGGHNETYGGITINIDSNSVYAPTDPRY